MAAALGGDLEALLRTLTPDVTLWRDGGGKGPATSFEPVHGREAVARLLVLVLGICPSSNQVQGTRLGGSPL